MLCLVAKSTFPVPTKSPTCIEDNIETILVDIFCMGRSIETRQIFHHKTSSSALFLLFFEASNKYQYCFQTIMQYPWFKWEDANERTTFEGFAYSSKCFSKSISAGGVHFVSLPQ